MKTFMLKVLIFLMLCSTAFAQQFYWRYQTAANCSTLSAGKAADLCFQTSDNTLWKCVPSAGDCDTAGEWKQTSGAGVTSHSDLTNLSYATAGHTGFQPTITTGTTSQYLRGDLSLATMPTNLSSFTNGPGYITSYTETDPVAGAKIGTLTSGNFCKGTGTAISCTDSSTYVTGTPWTGMGYLIGNQSITLGGILSGSGTTSITAAAAGGYYMPSTTDQTNWNKYNQWDGGSTGLNASTGKTSLGLNNVTNVLQVSSSSAPLYTTSGNMTIDTTGLQPLVAAGTTSQYWRGDKSWQTLDKTAVGLGSVTNNAQVYSASAPLYATAGNVTIDTTALVPTSRTVNGQSLGSNVTVTTISGNAGTATALASLGTSCTSGQYARGIDVNGNATGCSPDLTGGGGSISGLTTGKLTVASSSTTIADSIISQSGTLATVAGSMTVTGQGTFSQVNATTFVGALTGHASSDVNSASAPLYVTANNVTIDLTAYAPKASPTFTGTVNGITASMVGLGNVANTAQVTSVTASGNLASSGGTTPAITMTTSPTFSTGLTVSGASTLAAVTSGTQTITGNESVSGLQSSGSLSVTGQSTLTGLINGTSMNLSGQGTFSQVNAALVGNVTGNVSGTSGSTTGNAATATKLAATKNINGVAFDGSGDITVYDATKAPTASPTFTGLINGSSMTLSGQATFNGVVNGIDKTEVGLGNVANTAQVTSVTASGNLSSSGGTTPAITMTNAPTFTGLVTAPSMNISGQGTFSQVNATLNGNASTATALAGTPTLCSAGNYPLGINASGNAQSCTPASGGGTVTNLTALAGSNMTISSATTTTTPVITYGVTATPSFTSVSATTFTGALSGNASTATALASAPSKCSAGNYPLGIDVNGNAQNCTAAGGGSQTPLAGQVNGAGFGIINLGNTGIGTISPAYSLEVDGTIYANASTASIQLTSASGTANYFANSVGIGTTTVGSTLTVNGTASATRFNNQSLLNNYSTASQSPSATTRTYITGSQIAIPANKLQIGTHFRWTFDVTKTGAGTTTSTIDIAFGTAGTTSDTARVSFTKPAGTGVIDNGRFVIDAVVRGPLSSSGVVAGHMNMTHNLSATGLATIPVVDVTTISSAFDVTTPTYAGVCITTGTSDAYTIQLVTAETWNL